MKRYELSKLLFDQSPMVKPYPALVSPVVNMLDITAFFPGGQGLWKEEDSQIFPDILVLGQDFSTLSEYEKMARNETSDLKSPTWRELIVLFKAAGVDLHRCFFSNVFIGLRMSESSVGRFPGAKDKAFVKRNLEFLSYQIESIKPQVIITLGRPASEMLSKLSEDLLLDWENGKALSIPHNGIKYDVHIKSSKITCVALEHTSMRNSNVKRRRYKNNEGDFQGNEAEIQMLKDCINKSYDVHM